jgi:hypothetical protein
MSAVRTEDLTGAGWVDLLSPRPTWRVAVPVRRTTTCTGSGRYQATQLERDERPDRSSSKARSAPHD